MPMQESLDITDEKVKEMLKKIPNWKAPRSDGVQGFWLKISQACISILECISSIE